MLGSQTNPGAPGIFGLIFSTVLTLVVIPTLYVLFAASRDCGGTLLRRNRKQCGQAEFLRVGDRDPVDERL